MVLKLQLRSDSEYLCANRSRFHINLVSSKRKKAVAVLIDHTKQNSFPLKAYRKTENKLFNFSYTNSLAIQQKTHSHQKMSLLYHINCIV